MENNRIIFWTCLVISVVGITLISISHPEKVTSLSPNLIGKEVVLEGTLEKVEMHGNVTLLQVNGFKAVSFNKLTLPSIGTNISLYGTVEEYKGEVELVVRDLVD